MIIAVKAETIIEVADMKEVEEMIIIVVVEVEIDMMTNGIVKWKDIVMTEDDQEDPVLVHLDVGKKNKCNKE